MRFKNRGKFFCQITTRDFFSLELNQHILFFRNINYYWIFIEFYSLFQFVEEDIDTILDRRAKTVTIEGNKAGGSFSKATFASAETETDINLDDPDFWSKWAKKAEIEQIDESTKLMMVEPRSRKKTARLFGGNFLNLFFLICKIFRNFLKFKKILDFFFLI